MQDGPADPRAHLEALRADLQKYYRLHLGTGDPSLSRRLELWATHLGLHCVAAYRLCRWLRALGARHRWAGFLLVNVARAVELRLEVVHHVRIGAEVGPGFYIGHAGMIFIGPTRIGRNFSVTHAVTVGVGQAQGARGTPVIGDDVWVGTGAVLAGAIEVGNGATIASGAMVSRSVPPRTLVGGNPARVVLQGYDNTALLVGPTAAPPRWSGPPAARDQAGGPSVAVAQLVAGGDG